jgi:hypothetical protein
LFFFSKYFSSSKIDAKHIAFFRYYTLGFVKKRRSPSPHARANSNGFQHLKPAATKRMPKAFWEVLQKMPEDTRAAWASRLDTEQAKMACPVIGSEADLCKEFDEFCAAYDKNRRKPKQIVQQRDGGESTK